MKKLHTLSLILFVSLILAGCNLGQANKSQVTPNTSGETPTGVVSSFTLEEVAAHASAEDCWFVIDGKVYDVTQFIADKKHPGGAAILEGCGKDATVLFNTRPMGSGTAHSEAAQKLLQTFEIGTLTE